MIVEEVETLLFQRARPRAVLERTIPLALLSKFSLGKKIA
jgi:hypothetical protein